MTLGGGGWFLADHKPLVDQGRRTNDCTAGASLHS